MIHAIFAVGITAVAFWSNLGIIQVRLAVPIDWNMDPAPLLSSRQFVPPESSAPSQSAQTQARAFSLDNLASATTTSYQTWRPPTPPNDSGDSMDWTPSQPAFNPLPKPIHYLSAGPSPFHGRLPALPARGVQTYSGHLPNEPKEAIGLPPGFFDRKPNSGLPPRQQNLPGEAMAQPTFFGHDRQADTGLESIFETVFSFQDQNVGPSAGISGRNARSRSFHVSEARKADQVAPQTRNDASIQIAISGIAFFALLVALVTWLLEIAVKPEGSILGYYIVLASVSVPTIHFLHIIFTGRIHGHFLWLLIFAIEASSLVGLAFSRRLLEGGFRDLWNKLAIAAVALLLPQEFVRMNSSSLLSSGESQRTGPLPIAQAASTGPDSRTSVDPVISNLSYVQPPSTPKTRNGIFWRDSDDSSASRTTATTSSTTKGWESPNVHADRYEWEPYENRPVSPVRTTGMSSDLDGLSLNDTASRNNRVSSKHRGTLWDLPSSTLGSNPRARKGF